MQYLEDIKQIQNDELDNWQFGHINRFRHEPWERKAHKMRNRRSKVVNKKEQLMLKKLKKDSHAVNALQAL